MRTWRSARRRRSTRLSTYQVNFRAKIKRRQYLLAPRQRRRSKPEHCLHRTRLGNCSLGWFPAFLRTGHSMSAAGGGRNQATFDLRDSFFRLTVCCNLSAELSPSLHSPSCPILPSVASSIHSAQRTSSPSSEHRSTSSDSLWAYHTHLSISQIAAREASRLEAAISSRARVLRRIYVQDENNSW